MSELNGLSGKNKEENGTDTPAIDEFEAISMALASDDPTEIDRVMAAGSKDKEEAPKDDAEDENAEDTDEDGEDTPEDDADKGDDQSDNETDEIDEAATSAASTAKPDDKDLQAELHRLRSDAGRVPFLQRQLAELQRELRAQKARTPATSASGTGDKPTSQDLSSVELDEDIKKDIEELREIDPVQANLIERVYKKAIFAANSRADHVVDTFTQTEREQEEFRFLSEQKAILAQKIPDHERIFAAPEWKQWKETLTPGQRAMAESAYANEVEQAIYAFAADMRRLHGGAAAAQTETSEAAETVKKARAQKAAASPDVKATSAKKAEVLDDDAYFNEAYMQTMKDNHIL